MILFKNTDMQKDCMQKELELEINDLLWCVSFGSMNYEDNTCDFNQQIKKLVISLDYTTTSYVKALETF